MASRCSSASLAASPASFQPSNAATTTVWCSSGNAALPKKGPSGGVTELAYGLPPGDDADRARSVVGVPPLAGASRAIVSGPMFGASDADCRPIDAQPGTLHRTTILTA